MKKNKYANRAYLDYVDKKTPNSRHLITMLIAFLVGGAICAVGQGVSDLIKLVAKDIDRECLAALTTAVMIFLGAFFTGTGLYGKLGSFAGAGSVVPITGFANSVVSPAIEFKTEGFIYGVAAKMFVIAGPIIVYGALSSTLVGLIYYFIYL